MLRTIVFTFCVSLCQANEFFNVKLYHDVLDPDLCARQMESMDKYVFYDSSFREPEGLLGGNFISYGNFHQCLAINQNFPGSNIEGKYCFIQANLPTIPTLKIPTLGGASESNNLTWTEWKFNWSADDLFHYRTYINRDINVLSTNATEPSIQSVSLTLAVCVPKACTAQALLQRYTEHPLINFTYSEQFCRLPGDKSFTSVDYVLFCVWGLLGLLTFISTAYELRHRFILKKDPAETSQLLCACSLYRNTASLLTFPDHSETLDCLDGIRALSTLRIIVFHTFVIMFSYSANKLEFTQALFDLKYLWILTAPTTVDTFFVLSGMLLVYTVSYKMNKKNLLRNLHVFYMNRYVRLFPLLAGVVLLQASVMHRASDGPSWYYITDEFARCRKYWWSTFLHVQNYVNPLDLCVATTWYLSVDMQLYVLSPLVLYWTLGSARAAWIALTSAVVTSLAATLAACFNLNLNSLWMNGCSGESYEVWYYKNTITRSPPFFIGMLFGYLLHVFRGKKAQLPKWCVFLGHSVALALSFYSFYIVHMTMQPDWDNQAALNVHNALFRSCWALALCWLIFACAHGYGGPVNWLLSLKLWRFPARISYAMYLYSMPIQFVLYGAVVTPCHFSAHSLLEKFAIDMAYTVALSVAACVVIEEPILTLYRLLKAKYSRELKNTSKNK